MKVGVQLSERIFNGGASVVFAASDPFSYILSLFLFLVLFLASGNFIDRFR